MLSKKGQTREIYIGAILLFYAFFAVIYGAYAVTYTEFNPDCLENNNCPSNINGEYNNPIVNDETRTLMGSIFSSIPDMPLWVNLIFIFLTAMVILMITILILHG